MYIICVYINYKKEEKKNKKKVVCHVYSISRIVYIEYAYTTSLKLVSRPCRSRPVAFVADSAVCLHFLCAGCARGYASATSAAGDALRCPECRRHAVAMRPLPELCEVGGRLHVDLCLSTSNRKTILSSCCTIIYILLYVCYVISNKRKLDVL